MLSSKKPIILTISLYLLLGCAWILGTDHLLELVFPDPQTTLAWQSVKGLVFVVGTAVFYYLALRSIVAKVSVEYTLAVARGSEDVPLQDNLPTRNLRLWVPLGTFLLTILLLTAAGTAVYRQVSMAMRRTAWEDLRNVAGLKARQIKAWRQERLGDVATITGDGNFMSALQPWLQREASPAFVPERVARRMNAIRQGYGYAAVMIYDARGRRRFSASEPATEAPDPDAALLDRALIEGQAVFSDFHIPQPGQPHVIDFIVPLFAPSTADNSQLGVMVLRMAEQSRLFPDLHWWPAGIHRAETMLVQSVGSGDPALVTFQPDQTMKLESGGSGHDTHWASFVWHMNRPGVFETLDHRGVPVLAAVETVQDSAWLLIAKVPQDEVYRPLRRLGGASGVAVLFLIGVSAAGIGLWWRQQMAGLAVEWLHGQLHRQAMRKHLEYLTRFANDIILLLDDQGCVVEANDRAVATYGYPREVLIGTNARYLRDPATLDDFSFQWEAAYDKGIIFETRHRRADGSLFPVEVSARRVAASGKEWCQSIIRDITERKHAEQNIQRLTCLYNVLSQTNQAIVRHRDRQPLFEDICRIAVDLGFLRMAVITSVDLSANSISPVAAFGADQNFLDAINDLVLREETESWPTLQVATLKRSYICNDIALDPLLESSLEVARQYGFQSVALFPLLIDNEIFGTLNLYATEQDFFEPDLVAVLEEMATDINFALNTFEQEAARKKAEERLLETTSTLRTLYQATPLPVMIIDLEGRVTFWNPAAAELFGWSEQDILGQILPLVPEDQKEEFFRNLCLVKCGELLRGVEVRHQCRDGALLDMLSFSAPLYNAQHQVDSVVVLLMDVSEQKRAREHIVCLAHYDQLTGLANRTLLQERFIQESSRARRDERSLALCLIDLDKFKTVNDALGHTMGDKLLVQVARRMEDCLRRADLICRPGGDEFLVLLELENVHDAGKISRKILQKLEEPYSLDGHTVRISACMGVSLFPDDGMDLDTLFRNADTAMYAAKDRGRNNFMFFRNEMDHKIRNRLELENSLRVALEERTFFLHYQPQVEIDSGRIIGAEALLRFRHPVQGLISPDKIIPIAEDSGLIVPMGEWILEEACRQMKHWQENGLGDLTMAVNLSPVQVFQENFVGRTKDIMDAHGIYPGRLIFELTESIFMAEDDRVRQTLLALKKLGLGISLDDFGTGYSSLNYLKRYAVDEIKIDRSFVKDVCSDPSDAAIVQATIQMAHSLGLKTVAEGVETAGQLTFLRYQQCDSYQGYLCSRPLAPGEFVALVQNSRTLPTP